MYQCVSILRGFCFAVLHFLLGFTVVDQGEVHGIRYFGISDPPKCPKDGAKDVQISCKTTWFRGCVVLISGEWDIPLDDWFKIPWNFRTISSHIKQ